MIFVLESLLAKEANIRIMDSTMLEVCKLQRADHHKVAASIAEFGKNHQGWHFGFTLHASIDVKGRLCGLSLTPASQHDAQEIPHLVNEDTKVVVGDGAYNASVMREIIFRKYGTLIIAPPHFKQRKKIVAKWQMMLLMARPKIESVFDYLKNHLSLVTSFPRSVNGYLFHYLRVLISYQVMVGGGF